MFGRLPLSEQLDGLRSALSQNETLTDVMTRAATLELPGWYVTAGCLFQTVWNVATGRPPANGIKDYDIFYFDDSNLSWEAEDAVIKAGKTVFADLPAVVEIRNEARVHLWYEQKFGVPCPPHVSTEYETKTARWKSEWPELTVLPWPN
ncbi:nucleotidyltransferase family protein [Streptomyces hyaluromycini]|uniref:Nucleotidyltransferase family protein n=1 Tax=Streptomyces hyaluromycini TaxID=1377993 RepID=A0ABV1WRE5_9ACTN